MPYWLVYRKNGPWYEVVETYTRSYGDSLYPTKNEAIDEARRRNWARVLRKRAYAETAIRVAKEAEEEFEQGDLYVWNYESGVDSVPMRARTDPDLDLLDPTIPLPKETKA